MYYKVGIIIYNTFNVEAESEEEAEEQVRELDVYKTLQDSEFNIAYVDPIENEESTKPTQKPKANEKS